MFLEVAAVPDVDAPARVGERFTPRPGAPLRIGPGRDARIRLRGLGMNLEVASGESQLILKVPPSAVRASLSGIELQGSTEVPLAEGDTLYVHPGLALVARERPARRARETRLEARLHAVDEDETTWAVYADFLEEQGDPLATWIRQGTAVDERQRRRRLGALADAARGGLLEVTFGARGLLHAAHFTRQAVVGAPGLSWHLSQLRSLPAARFLRELGLALFAGAAPARVDDEKDPDALAAETLRRLEGADFLPGLRRLTLGFVQEARDWPRAHEAFARLAAAAPSLEADFGQVIRTGGRARFVVVSQPPDVRTVSGDVVLHPGRTDVGAAPSCLVRLVGDVSDLLCTVHRMTDGQWVVFDERADPFSKNHDALTLKVNGVPTARAVLAPGDLVEPTPGLALRFVL